MGESSLARHRPRAPARPLAVALGSPRMPPKTGTFKGAAGQAAGPGRAGGHASSCKPAVPKPVPPAPGEPASLPACLARRKLVSGGWSRAASACLPVQIGTNFGACHPRPVLATGAKIGNRLGLSLGTPPPRSCKPRLGVKSPPKLAKKIHSCSPLEPGPKPRQGVMPAFPVSRSQGDPGPRLRDAGSAPSFLPGRKNFTESIVPSLFFQPGCDSLCGSEVGATLWEARAPLFSGRVPVVPSVAVRWTEPVPAVIPGSESSVVGRQRSRFCRQELNWEAPSLKWSRAYFGSAGLLCNEADVLGEGVQNLACSCWKWGGSHSPGPDRRRSSSSRAVGSDLWRGPLLKSVGHREGISGVGRQRG